MIKKSFVSVKDGKLSKIVLENCEDLSYANFCRAIRNKDVIVNGKRVREDGTVKSGDNVELFYNQTLVKKYEIVYKDENVLVIDKKSGFTSESVYEDIKAQYRNVKFIHRLDRNTGGLMIFALDDTAEKELLYAFKNRTPDKYYLATVVGKMPKKQDVLTAYLRKDSENSKVYIYPEKVSGSALIKTGYKVIKEGKGTSLLEVKLFTGKTHQIRAHLAFIGHPIVGDGKYGDNATNKKFGKKSQELVAYKLVLHFKENDKLFYLDGKTFVRG